MLSEQQLQQRLESLSPDQKTIYEHLVKGKTVEQIASEMERPEGIISAQRTRIINKGIDLPELPGQSSQPTESTSSQPTQPKPSASRPASTGGSSNSDVLRQATQAGDAEYDVEKVIEQVRQQVDPNLNVRDVHPMVLLGVTIQFMKLRGGRMHAHQLIEDVYGALRTMVDGGQMPDVPGATSQTKPWPPEKSSGQQLSPEELVQQMSAMQQQLSQLLQQNRS